MNQEMLATCQCIISQPSRAAFMAIKHTSGYRPPEIMVPVDADLSTNVRHIVQGIRSKYGLQTTLLRHLARFRDYHCVELEMHGKDARRLQAIWVGPEDYTRSRGAAEFEFDPLLTWLREKESGVIPPQRPPWERHGWYRKAEHWINFQLDRLNIQATGSVSQHRALLHAGTVLRVPTSRGRFYFKATYDKAPREAPLTHYLAEQWPEFVGKPLAMDASRNWMLLADFSGDEGHPITRDGLLRAAVALGQIQVASIGKLTELRGLGCQDQGMQRLQAFLARPGGLAQLVPEIGDSGLTAEERASLDAAAPGLARDCAGLAACGVPETLVHPDFRAANILGGTGVLRVIDWQNTAIAHPFFALLKLLRDDHPAAFSGLTADPLVQAYLQPFQALVDDQTLQRAIDLAARLQHGWRLMRWTEEFPYFESAGVALANAQRFVVRLARDLLASERAIDR